MEPLDDATRVALRAKLEAGKPLTTAEWAMVNELGRESSPPGPTVAERPAPFFDPNLIHAQAGGPRALSGADWARIRRYSTDGRIEFRRVRFARAVGCARPRRIASRACRRATVTSSTRGRGRSPGRRSDDPEPAVAGHRGWL